MQVVVQPPSVTIYFGLVKLEELKQKIILPKKVTEGKYGSATFSLIDKRLFRYEFGKHFYVVSYAQSAAVGYSRESTKWTKFGEASTGSEHIRSGFYIMENDGFLYHTGSII